MYANGIVEEDRSNQERMATIGVLLALGLIVGTVLALVLAPKVRKPRRRRFVDKLEHTFEDGLESTAATVKRLEKEFAELRKKVESRVGDLR